MKLQCEQWVCNPDGEEQCCLDADHRERLEHHFARGLMVEWPCYEPSPSRTRLSMHRGDFARSVIGDRPAPGGQFT